ncbi:MAG: carboxypeptidase regulatory-like domain-containing protein [Pyrinomonadaceae bacterium]
MKKRVPLALLHTLPLAALFALACALLAPAAPARRATQEQEELKKSQLPSNSTLYGRAIYDDTNRPVRRARVMLVDETGSRPEYNALTDSDGAFRIEHVREGSYLIFIDAPGVISPIGFVNFSALRGRGAPDFTEARNFLDVVDVDGKQDARVTARARRGAALGGKVAYADGDPAVNVSVNVMRRDAGGHLEKILAGINITAISGLRTDDRGIFRVSGLPPGEYVVSVSEQAEHGGEGGEDVGSRDPTASVLEGLSRQQFLMTFYPSATSAKEAVVIKADAGVERSDIDITIPERALHLVSGVVRGKSDKRPVKGARVTIVRRDEDAGAEPSAEAYISDNAGSSNGTTTDAEGHWEFKEIPEGPYTIFVKPTEEYEETTGGVSNMNANMNANMSSSMTYDANISGGYRRPRRKKGYAPTRRDVQVIDSDLSDLAVELTDGGRVSGTVTFEGGKSGNYGSVSLRRVPDGGTAPGAEDGWAAYAADGRFEINGLPTGKYFIQFSSYGESGRLYAKSITWNGKDLTREPLEIGEGATAEGIRIVVSNNPSKLRVHAAGAAHKNAAGGVEIILVPADVAGWSPYTQPFACTTEEDGTCEIAAPPGDYHVVAIPPGGMGGSPEAELKRRATAAPRVTLAAGETKEFAVVVPEK